MNIYVSEKHSVDSKTTYGFSENVPDGLIDGDSSVRFIKDNESLLVFDVGSYGSVIIHPSRLFGAIYHTYPKGTVLSFTQEALCS